MFHSLDAFGADQVWPGPGHNRWPDPSMKIDQQLSISRLAAQSVVEIDHELIVPLHEIDLDAFDSPLLELIERRLELVIQRLPHAPENDPDILLLAISDQFLDIHSRHYLEQVAQLVPSLVQYYVLNPVFRSEIDIVLVGLGIDACLEIDAVDIVGIPPVPCDLPRFDPGDIRY